jgi:alpha-tubulin suppressor-like RCC1 family protein
LGQYPAEDSTQDVVEYNNEGVSDSSKLVGGSADVEVEMEGPGSVRPLHSPQRLVLPPGLTVREVWAGSEFTVVADQHGYLWATGWNEHGNLGRDTEGLAFVSSDGWVKVMHSGKSPAAVNGGLVMEGREGASDRHVRLSVVWEGGVSCGGGHILALTGHMSHP